MIRWIKQQMSWSFSVMVIVAAIGLAAISQWWLNGLTNGGGTFNLFLVFILYTSLVIKGIHWLTYEKEDGITDNLQRLAAYLGMYALAFIVSSFVLGIHGRDVIMLAFISVCFGVIYSFNDLKYVFRRGWNTFLSVMVIPVLLVVWLIMHGWTSASWFDVYSMYDYFIASGVVYWLLIICTLALFSRHIIKQPQDSSSTQ